MAVYDTEKIRRAASMMNGLADSLSDGVRPDFIEAIERMEGCRGKTAQRIEDQLQNLAKTTNRELNEIEGLARLLNAYADNLEEADRRLAGAL